MSTQNVTALQMTPRVIHLMVTVALEARSKSKNLRCQKERGKGWIVSAPKESMCRNGRKAEHFRLRNVCKLEIHVKSINKNYWVT